MTNTLHNIGRTRSDILRTMKSLERHIGEIHHNRNKLIGLYKRLDTLKRPIDISRCIEDIKYVRTVLDDIANNTHIDLSKLEDYNDVYMSTCRQEISSVKREIDAAESDKYRSEVHEASRALSTLFPGR